MNPYLFIVNDFYGDPASKFGLAAAAVLLLRTLAAGYGGEMPASSTPYKWVLDQLAQYGATNDFYRYLATQWHAKANPHI